MVSAWPRQKVLVWLAVIGLHLAPEIATAGDGVGSAVDALAYTHPQTMVALHSGRRMNLFCLGHGYPTVFFEAGLGSGSVAWRHVQQSVSETTRACSYDRAGYGFSEPSDRPSDAQNAVDDLHALLQRSGIVPPIVLVGHSRGGQYATLYAELYPSDVTGLVLVDPSFTHQDQLLNSHLSPSQQIAQKARIDGKTSHLRRCLELTSGGFLSWLPNSGCLDDSNHGDSIIRIELNRQWSLPSYWKTALSEHQSAHASGANTGLSSDDQEMPTLGPHFGAMPVAVLTSSKMASESWLAGHVALAAASTGGQSILVKDSGHYIQDDQPSAVVVAIIDVIEKVRRLRR